MAKQDFKFVPPNDAHYYIKLSGRAVRRATHYTLILSDDPNYPGHDSSGKVMWEDVIYLAEAVYDASGAVRKPEYVYILVNGSMPGMVKIGMTTTSVTQRVHEINRATGVPTPWIPVFDYKCMRADLLEAELHDYFDSYRVADNREMFHVDSITVQNAIDDLGGKYRSPLYIKNMETDVKE
jgi:hypothetical protein